MDMLSSGNKVKLKFYTFVHFCHVSVILHRSLQLLTSKQPLWPIPNQNTQRAVVVFFFLLTNYKGIYFDKLVSKLIIKLDIKPLEMY